MPEDGDDLVLVWEDEETEVDLVRWMEAAGVPLTPRGRALLLKYARPTAAETAPTDCQVEGSSGSSPPTDPTAGAPGCSPPQR